MGVFRATYSTSRDRTPLSSARLVYDLTRLGSWARRAWNFKARLKLIKINTARARLVGLISLLDLGPFMGSSLVRNIIVQVSSSIVKQKLVCSFNMKAIVLPLRIFPVWDSLELEKLVLGYSFI